MIPLYSEYSTWRKERYQGGDGVLVGCDATQEWLLPWWWNHYSRHNLHPVLWIDLGLTEKMKEWCRKRGTLITLRIADIFVVPREEILSEHASVWENQFGIAFWNCRNAWFKKPFAFLQTPFKRSIWIDTDCEVKGSISPLFSYADHPSGLAMRPETYCWRENEPLFNSGVVVFQWGLPCIELWAQWALEKSDQFAGDQDILSQILLEKKISIPHLPDRYNQSRRDLTEEALILHWHGSNGKKIIESKLIQERLDGLL